MQDGNSTDPRVPGGGASPTPARRRFTAEAKETISNQLVGGMTYSEVASFHSCDAGDISKLAATSGMKERIERRRTQLLEAGNRIMFKFLMHADRLAEDQVQTALSPGDPNHYNARKWILERVAPARTVISQQQVEVNHHITHEVMVGLMDTIREVNKALPTTAAGPNGSGMAPLLDGKTALPPVDFNMDVES